MRRIRGIWVRIRVALTPLESERDDLQDQLSASKWITKEAQDRLLNRSSGLVFCFVSRTSTSSMLTRTSTHWLPDVHALARRQRPNPADFSMIVSLSPER